MLFLLLLLTGAVILRSVYRLYFHPLSKVPGPKLAAITHLYEFYHNVIRPGMFLWKIEEMHKKYGPIVRVNPREVHVTDPEFYDEIYAAGSKVREKDPMFAAIYSAPHSLVATLGHTQHRLRRHVLSPFFSRKAIKNLEPLIDNKLAQLQKRFQAAYLDSTVLHLDVAFSALVSEVVTHYCYGSSYGFLENDDFSSSITSAIDAISCSAPINKLLPSLATLARLLPEWIMTKFQPSIAGIYKLQDKIRQQSLEALQESCQSDSIPARSNTTLYSSLTNPKIPPEERAVQRLVDEQMSLLVAGSVSTTNTLLVAAFHLLQNKSILLKLRRELKVVLPTPTSVVRWSDLEKLPYLVYQILSARGPKIVTKQLTSLGTIQTGVVNEALRLSFGGASRFPRVAPYEALTYRSYTIPAGVSMSPPGPPGGLEDMHIR
ncbi:hypothetical protein Asppvi_009334 [Aspergillus pseudoviridinutans]|uniref:Cytochrome P450 n=1 Tax=Aspergillus pseudoviridinutans TaxID=1517512 RepID=A0A9P3BFW6_9EURO|nr:uncharacterized protein Asppvi_009334 [Aspergillus pseudoviridinutans]GIJ90380.1 hypothetical protein Asppvi_009334 [Aspergillus pseudoviridinutans]